jgi:hypothetical protein
MNRLILMTILFISLLACKKQTPTFKISGVITDKSLNSGLSNAVVTFYKVKAGTTNTSKISSTNTDSNGNFTIEFDRDQSESYYVKIEKENYFEVYKEITFSSLKVGETNTRNYDIYAKSWVKIHLQNLTPEPGDYITISKQEGKKDCSECCSFYQLTTSNSDTLFYCVNDGNTNYSILYSSFGDQTLKTDIKEIKTIPFDTSELKIEY